MKHLIRFSTWCNRELWTGNNRSTCAEVYGRFLDAPYGSWKEAYWRGVVSTLGFLALNSWHCRDSWWWANSTRAERRAMNLKGYPNE